MSRSLTFHLETKMPWRQTPSRKKKAVLFTNVTTNAYQDQINAGFSKVCEIFKVRGIESLKYIQEFHTPVCYYGDISMPRNVTLNETNCDWLFDMSVKRPHGRALANERGHTEDLSLKVWLRETRGTPKSFDTIPIMTTYTNLKGSLMTSLKLQRVLFWHHIELQQVIWHFSRSYDIISHNFKTT